MKARHPTTDAGGGPGDDDTPLAPAELALIGSAHLALIAATSYAARGCALTSDLARVANELAALAKRAAGARTSGRLSVLSPGQRAVARAGATVALLAPFATGPEIDGEEAVRQFFASCDRLLEQLACVTLYLKGAHSPHDLRLRAALAALVQTTGELAEFFVGQGSAGGDAG